MEFNYVNNNSFSINQIFFLKYYIKNIKKLKIEFHIMSKNLNILIKKLKIKNFFIHIENVKFFKKNKFCISPNFCWNYIKKNTKTLLMSVNPGFGNQIFLKSSIKKKIKKNNIDGGINFKIFKKIKNYFNKIIIGSNIVNKKNILSYFLFNYIINEFIIN